MGGMHGGCRWLSEQSSEPTGQNVKTPHSNATVWQESREGPPLRVGSQEEVATELRLRDSGGGGQEEGPFQAGWAVEAETQVQVG